MWMVMEVKRCVMLGVSEVRVGWVSVVEMVDEVGRVEGYDAARTAPPQLEPPAFLLFEIEVDPL